MIQNLASSGQGFGIVREKNHLSAGCAIICTTRCKKSISTPFALNASQMATRTELLKMKMINRMNLLFESGLAKNFGLDRVSSDFRLPFRRK